ncbi:hypothetical protein AIT68_005393, partial [Salmonella enterica subsp. salamae]
WRSGGLAGGNTKPLKPVKAFSHNTCQTKRNSDYRTKKQTEISTMIPAEFTYVILNFLHCELNMLNIGL